MAVEVEVVGNGRYAGSRSNIGTYSVSEESTPIEASDSSGGTGQITFSAVDDPSRLGSMLLLNDTVKLTDGDRGNTEGRINSLVSNDGTLNVTADSRLGRLVVEKIADPVNGTFSDAMLYYLSLAGITTDIAIEDTLASLPVVAKGWNGDLWTKVKELCVIYGAEISLVKGTVVVRAVRGRRALEINNVTDSWSVSNTELAKEVEVYYYNSEYKTAELVYPPNGWNEDVTIYTVDAGQTINVNIPVDVSITSIVQPTAQDYVAREHDSSSVYAVAGNDALPIVASQWLADGGSLVVAIGEDKQSIDLTVRGAEGATAEYAPYRIAVSAGSSDYYSSLRIVGDGLHFSQNSVIVPTGADEESTSRDIGVTVDNIYVRTEAQARDIAAEVAGKWSAPIRTISITKSYINKPGETDEDYNYATFGEFDAYAIDEGLTTFALFDAEWAGSTFGEFDDYWYSLVADSFDHQVFGNANGARVQFRRALYRIRSATITESQVSYVAEADTTFGDFDESADLDAGMTFDDFDDLYDGMSFADFALVPLPIVYPEYDR